MIYTVYKDNYVILEVSTLTSVEVDLDLLFDRFRWSELSLGFACTGNSFSRDVSLGLWELNDVTSKMMKEQQAIQVHVNVRSANNRLPLRPLFTVWDLALPISMISNLRSITMKVIPISGVSPIQRNTLPDFYSKHSTDDIDKESWATSISSIDHVITKHQTTEQGNIVLTAGGERIGEEKFRSESFRPALISGNFETMLNSFPPNEERWITATRI